MSAAAVAPEPVVDEPADDSTGFVVSRSAEAQRLAAFITAKRLTLTKFGSSFSLDRRRAESPCWSRDG